MRGIIVFAVWWLFLFALYLLLAGELSGPEIGAGLIVALVATCALTAVRRESRWAFAARVSWLRPLATVSLRAVFDSLVVLRSNCVRPFRTRSSGRFSERAFNAGNNHGLARARRALVTAAISLPPNSFVVAVDQKRNRLLVHELVPQQHDEPRDPDWPL